MFNCSLSFKFLIHNFTEELPEKYDIKVIRIINFDLIDPII